MNVARRGAAVASILLAALAVSGCVESEAPEETALPSATPEETLSEAEALEMVRGQYEGYLATTLEMIQTRNFDYTLLLEYTTPEIATNDVAQMQQLVDLGWRQEGANELQLIEVRDGGSDNPLLVLAAACVNTSTVRFFDAEGNDVTPESAQDAVSLSLTFTRIDTDHEFLLESQGPWESTEDEPCQPLP